MVAGPVKRPYLAPALQLLVKETNELWPRRDKRSDGWIGDAAHAARVSDHNPDSGGVVRAVDITNNGVNVQRLVVACTHHPSVHYVISRSVIYSRNRGFRGQPYKGPDPHDEHVHVSIKHTAPAALSRRSWL